MRINNSRLSAERLREVIHYEPTTGVFTWIKPTTRSVKVGDVAGSPDRYVGIVIDGRRHYGHRLAWLYVHGQLPLGPIDHVNGNGLDNRIENIRPCTDSENQQNRAANRTNKTGLIGISWHNRDSRWHAQIGMNGKTYSLGFFKGPIDAHNAYLEAKLQIHNFQSVPRNKGV